MNRSLVDLLKLLELERLEINLFRGESRDIGSPQVFGGQVLGQALMAASETVDERLVHSLHAYFLRRGDFDAPIVYEVDRSLDGSSFSNRRVVAIQHGKQIFHLSASFHRHEDGAEHHVPAPQVTPPEQLQDLAAIMRCQLQDLPAERRRFWSLERPFEFRSVETIEDGKPQPAVRHLWFRLVDRSPHDPVLNRCLLAYMSDFHLLETATLPHGGLSPRASDIMMASIDHAMWFHRSFEWNDWLLYALESPSSSGARGFALGNVFDREGRLVASTAQEGLMRFRMR